MATSERRLDRGRDQAVRIMQTVGADIRLTRRGSGVSLRVAASSIGVSHPTLSRIERGRIRNLSVDRLALACAAVGLKLVARAYPDGDPVRDVAHTLLLSRLRSRTNRTAIWRTEVPIPIPGDLRAWDAQCTLQGVIVGIEAEMRIDDLQALERKVALKCRDAGLVTVVLLVADTPRNRRRISEHRASLATRFPLDTRAVLAALGAGRPPAASGIVIL